MKKLLLLFVASFCIGVAMAQEPKAAAKKASPVKLKNASEADRVAAKKKHYEALKSSEAPQAEKAGTKANTVSGARTRSAN